MHFSYFSIRILEIFGPISLFCFRFQLENESSFTTKKGRSVDNSIARAYTAAIRRAERFIYIENQYFMGSAYGWLDDRDVHCYNVIPMEITRKICESIENGRRFSVYIVIPLHPEGIPSDNAIQEMLFWQRHTMQMMYTRIAHALLVAGIDAHPTDYLMFFCLGKKENKADLDRQNLAMPSQSSRAGKLRKSRRFMIYVHSKLMIVDDSYAIVGSANINQRSLDGDRDSELAIGIGQPKTAASDPTQGEIFKLCPNVENTAFPLHGSKLICGFTGTIRVYPFSEVIKIRYVVIDLISDLEMIVKVDITSVAITICAI